MTAPDVGICHVITLLELGGAQENTLYTVSHLRPPFRASLVCGEGGILDDEARAMAEVPTIFVRSLVRPIRPTRDLDALARLTGIFRRMRPRIVHTHSSKAGILGRIAARLAGVPVIIHTIHGYGFNAGQPAPLRAAIVALEKAVAPLTTHFIAVSRANLDQGVDLGIFPRRKATLIRSGIPIATFEAAAGDRAVRKADGLRRELGLPEGRPLVGMIACLKPQKSPLTFVEVAGRLSATGPQASFVVAGDGELRGVVMERVKALGLSGRFHLLGWRRDIPRILEALDVLVLTSLWEGLPKVVPEAIAAGVPVVATAVDGTAELLQDGVNGFLSPPGDVVGLASRVERLLRDPDLGRAAASRARGALAEFDIDAMVRAQEHLYGELLRAAPTSVNPF